MKRETSGRLGRSLGYVLVAAIPVALVVIAAVFFQWVRDLLVLGAGVSAVFLLVWLAEASKTHRWALILLSVFGVLFLCAFALGATAYFSDWAS